AMNVGRWLALAGGVVLVAATFASVVGTLIVPGDTPGRIAGMTSRIFGPTFRLFTRLFRTYERRDRVLALQAPWLLLALLATWLGLLLCSYAAILWSITRLDVAGAFREAAS